MFTTKMILPGWDSTTTSVQAEPAFLPLVAALVVVLEGGEGDCNPGSPVSLQSHSSSNVHHENAPTRVGLDDQIYKG